MNSKISIKDVACVLLHTKPFDTGPEYRQWRQIYRHFVAVFKEQNPGNDVLIKEFKQIVEEE